MEVKFTTKILNTDGVPDAVGDIWSMSALSFDEYVLVYYEYPLLVDEPVVLGFARLQPIGTELFAHMRLHLSDDPVKAADIKERYPVIFGRVLERQGGRIMRARIDSIALSDGPFDGRIKSIGEALDSL